MRPVETVEGTVVSIRRADIDTDQIIPQTYLKRVERSGYGDHLFDSWAQDPDFALNQPERTQAKVLVTGSNFGCGSSREHAVWAILDRGFEAVIAPSFADIFSNNATNNGLVLARLPEDDVDRIHDIAADPSAVIQVSVAAGEVRSDEEVWRFDLDPEVRRRLLGGLDMIGVTLEYEADISAFEAAQY